MNNLFSPLLGCYDSVVKKIVTIYALALACAIFVLEWLQYKAALRAFTTEWFIAVIAVLFLGLGAWLAWSLMPTRQATEFEINHNAIQSIGITPREVEVLQLLSMGQSNKEVARSLDLAPNTIKTHIASLFRKLEVSRRTQAIRKAQSLCIIP